MKPSTINKLIKDMQDIKKSGLNIPAYLKSIGKDTNNISVRISQFKSNLQDVEKYPEVLELYKEIKSIKSTKNSDEGMRWWVDRDEEGIITKYHIIYPIRDSAPFYTTLTREDVETIYSLYTYYGGNVTARQVTNEFPKYTLSEIKKIFRVFGLTKDSSWLCPHLTEELTLEQAAQYRMTAKERAAFKYCDARQERDFTNQIKKMASEINQLRDRNELVKSLTDPIEYEKVTVNPEPYTNTLTGVICLSDLHVGAYNVPEGYLNMVEYNEAEINRRLDKVIRAVRGKNWESVVVLNLGDSIDSYRQMTTSMSHQLPCVNTDREIATMYIRVMKRFFDQLSQCFGDIQYCSIGSGNHSGDYGWLCDIALSQQLKELDIDCYVSNNEIDAININSTSFVYLHGKTQSTKGQFKGFPLNLNEKTQCWFNDFFADTDLKLCDRKVVLKGDLHQYAINSVPSFDYINCPSLYGSSTYIVSNWGLTPWACAYLEVNVDGSYVSGIIKD